MAAADDCANLLREGRSPLEIADARGISVGSVLDYLDRAVGKALIRRSEIYFSVPSSTRELVEKLKRTGVRSPADYDRYVHQKEYADALPLEKRSDVQVCLRYGPASRYYGDLYEELRGFEVDLHALVRHALVREYGNSGRAWWFQGVDEGTRKSAVVRAEELGRDGYDPWLCVTLIELGSTITKRWTIFSPLLRAPSSREFNSEIAAVGQVRNRVMHPVRDMPPDEHDFDLVRVARQRVDAARTTFYGEAEAVRTRTSS